MKDGDLIIENFLKDLTELAELLKSEEDKSND